MMDTELRSVVFRMARAGGDETGSPLGSTRGTHGRSDP